MVLFCFFLSFVCFVFWGFFLPSIALIWKRIRIIVTTTTSKKINVSGEMILRVYKSPPTCSLLSRKSISHLFSYLFFILNPLHKLSWHYFVRFDFDPRKTKFTHYWAKVLNTFMYMHAPESSKDLVLFTSSVFLIIPCPKYLMFPWLCWRFDILPKSLKSKENVWYFDLFIPTPFWSIGTFRAKFADRI